MKIMDTRGLRVVIVVFAISYLVDGLGSFADLLQDSLIGALATLVVIALWLLVVFRVNWARWTLATLHLVNGVVSAILAVQVLAGRAGAGFSQSLVTRLASTAPDQLQFAALRYSLIAVVSLGTAGVLLLAPAIRANFAAPRRSAQQPRPADNTPHAR